MDWGTGFVHGILQARILEWVTIPFSRGSSWPMDWTQVSCITGKFFTISAPGRILHPKFNFNFSPSHNPDTGSISDTQLVPFGVCFSVFLECPSHSLIISVHSLWPISWLLFSEIFTLRGKVISLIWGLPCNNDNSQNSHSTCCAVVNVVSTLNLLHCLCKKPKKKS